MTATTAITGRPAEQARQRAIVLSGGETPHPQVGAHLPSGALVIAADSGYHDAAALGLAVEVLVGDLDSIDPDDLAEAERRRIDIERHPPEKDATDLDLAFDAARRHGANRVTLVTGGGGRLDHLLGGIALLGSPRYADLYVDAWIGTAHVLVAHGPSTTSISGLDELVTLLAVNQVASGITTRGLRYPLGDDTLSPGETRGVSNEIVAADAAVTVASGTLLIVRPHALKEIA